MIRRAALDAGAGFADAGPALRTAAERRPIHGPRDWKHLNQDGQTVLGLVVADALAGRPGHRGTCR